MTAAITTVTVRRVPVVTFLSCFLDTISTGRCAVLTACICILTGVANAIATEWIGTAVDFTVIRTRGITCL